jgi:hypothetical protein
MWGSVIAGYLEYRPRRTCLSNSMLRRKLIQLFSGERARRKSGYGVDRMIWGCVGGSPVQ